jgi:protocatechuate 3,4-dioxygenase beta subunit
MEDDDILTPSLGRRQILHGAGALGILGLMRLAAARSARGTIPAPAGLDVSDLVDGEALQTMCVFTPSMTAGPYYLNLNIVRTDITEGLPGLPTRLYLHVVHASDCSPVPNCTVDLWHADAIGRYSGFANQGTFGQTFLRGVQFTDPTGQAYFDTIFPGWYPGRTTHFHLKVRPIPSVELTTQLYFRDRLCRRVNALPQYATHGHNPTTDGTDPLFRPETLVNVLGTANGQLQLQLTIGIA